jgi:hypothetical protein
MLISLVAEGSENGHHVWFEYVPYQNRFSVGIYWGGFDRMNILNLTTHDVSLSMTAEEIDGVFQEFRDDQRWCENDAS